MYIYGNITDYDAIVAITSTITLDLSILTFVHRWFVDCCLDSSLLLQSLGPDEVT
jgi:hypothetical protein